MPQTKQKNKKLFKDLIRDLKLRKTPINKLPRSIRKKLITLPALKEYELIETTITSLERGGKKTKMSGGGYLRPVIRIGGSGSRPSER